MIRFLRFLLRRTLIFTLVASLAFGTVGFFPYLDDKLPFWLAALVTYSVLAYVGIPAAMRIFRVFDQPNHVPTYSVTSDGWPSDPVNVAILARSEREFKLAMKQSGWCVADKGTWLQKLREGYALLFDKPYPAAPFSSLYLFGRKQDLGFQIPAGNSPRRRHHIRFWHVTHEDLLDLREAHEHEGFWRRLFKKFWQRELQLWVGTASYDAAPVAIIWRNGQLTHKIDPNVNTERDFLLMTLEQAGVVKTINPIKAGEPYRGRGQTIGITVISDGFVKLCELKPRHRFRSASAR